MNRHVDVPLKVAESAVPLIAFVDSIFWEAHPHLKGKKLPGGGKDPELEAAWQKLFVDAALGSLRTLVAERARLNKDLISLA